MAEEYKRKWHEHHDPKADQKEYIGTKILDNIEKSAVEWYQDERTLEGWEYLNPASVATAGAIRTVEGVGTVLAHTPIVAQGLQAVGKVEDVAAGTAGSITGSLNLDPRFGGWATRLASAWYGGKVISAASKSKYAKAAGKFAKIQADEVGMKASMAMKKKHGKVWKNPKAGVEPDPWFAKDDIGGPKKTYERFQERRAYGPEYGTENPMWMDPKEIARRNNIKMNLFNYIDSTSDVPLSRNPTFGEMFDIKNIINNQQDELLELGKNPNITQTTRMGLAKSGQYSGYDAGGWFRYKKFRTASGKMTNQGRPWLQIYQSPKTIGGASRVVPFDNFRFQNLPQLRLDFAPAIKALGLKHNQFNIHHIAALKASMGIWDGLQYNSPLYKEVSNTLLEELPGLGDMESNLFPVVGRKGDVGTPHHIVHKFYANEIGESGELFFTDEVLKGMNVSKEFRLRKTRELAKILKRSEAIVRQAQQVWEDVYSIKPVTKGTKITAFDNFVERLSKFNDEGFIETIGPEYQVPQMRGLIESIQFQTRIEPILPAVKAVYDPEALDALAIAVEEGISSVKALKQKKFGKQLKFAIDQITPENLPLIQKARRGTTPGNIASPDYETPSQKGQE